MTANPGGPPAVDAMGLLLQQLRLDEQRIIKARKEQQSEGVLSSRVTRYAAVSGAAKGFDFPLPGATGVARFCENTAPSVPLPTPPQRKGFREETLGHVRVPVAPALEKGDETVVIRGKRRFSSHETLTNAPPAGEAADTSEVRAVATPRLETPRPQGAVVAEGATPQRAPSSRSSSACSAMSGYHSLDESEDRRLGRLEAMLMEERAGRLEMLEKVNALSHLLMEQNKRLQAKRKPRGRAV